MSKKTYLGDGLYYSFDGYQVELSAENGIETTNRVFLEPSVLASFLEALRGDFPVDRLVAVLRAR